jgi:6-pyruvoyltetrahydropterin/6-carboxytetrahydropterin synthase
MRHTIRKRFTFEASHVLPWHQGKCQRLHGHSYKLEVFANAPLNDNGIVMDFDDISSLVDEHVIRVFDHHHLNDFLPNPTAELIADHILTVLHDKDVRIFKVRLYETEKCFAEVEWTEVS